MPVIPTLGTQINLTQERVQGQPELLEILSTTEFYRVNWCYYIQLQGQSECYIVKHCLQKKKYNSNMGECSLPCIQSILSPILSAMYKLN